MIPYIKGITALTTHTVMQLLGRCTKTAFAVENSSRKLKES